MSRLPGGGLARLIIRNRGRKGVKDAALAEECGFRVGEMYRRLGQKLLLIPRSGWFELEREKRGSEELALPSIVFTLSGVAAVTAWLDTAQSRKVGLDLVHLLSIRRRASKNKQRRPRRANDPARQAKYQSANGRMQAAGRKLRIKLDAELDLRSRRGVSARSGPVLSGSPMRSRTRKSRAP